MHMKIERSQTKQTHRILIVGPGDSGKSTLIKQMQKINSKNHDIPPQYKHLFFAPFHSLNSLKKTQKKRIWLCRYHLSESLLSIVLIP